MSFYSDLILESAQLWNARPGDPGDLPGIVTHRRRDGSVSVTEVEVLNEEGSAAVGKPVGRYLTLTLEEPLQGESFQETAQLLAEKLRTMLPPGKGCALVLGLGNRAVTPDAVGPWTAEEVFVTRHLIRHLPQSFGGFRPVAAAATGVLGTTGLESGELASSLCQQLHPDAVIAVDALAAQAPSRLCRTIQLSDSGIIPGSGVGNARFALNRETLGVPVIAVGVPTVIRAAALSQEPQQELDSLIVTPSDIDAQAAELAKLLGCGISLALQEGLSFQDLRRLTD